MTFRKQPTMKVLSIAYTLANIISVIQMWFLCLKHIILLDQKCSIFPDVILTNDQCSPDVALLENLRMLANNVQCYPDVTLVNMTSVSQMWLATLYEMLCWPIMFNVTQMLRWPIWSRCAISLLRLNNFYCVVTKTNSHICDLSSLENNIRRLGT